MTAKEAILKTLGQAWKPMPIHEFQLIGVSETAISARLRELARDGVVEGHRVEGKSYKAWTLKNPTGALSAAMINAALPNDYVNNPEVW